jgi:hypothetical protein
MAAETEVTGMGIGFHHPIDRDLRRGWLRVTDRRGYGHRIDGWGPTYEAGHAWVRGWRVGIWLCVDDY